MLRKLLTALAILATAGAMFAAPAAAVNTVTYTEVYDVSTNINYGTDYCPANNQQYPNIMDVGWGLHTTAQLSGGTSTPLRITTSTNPCDVSGAVAIQPGQNVWVGCWTNGQAVSGSTMWVGAIVYGPANAAYYGYLPAGETHATNIAAQVRVCPSATQPRHL